MRLAPDPAVTPDDIDRSKHMLVRDGAWSSLAGSLAGGIVLVAFAVELGASPFTIGVLGAIPALGQLAQLPAISLIERIRERRRITVISLSAGRLLILAMAILPFLPASAPRLPALLIGQMLITLSGAIGVCALNSWLHQLLPRATLGAFFARKLFWSTLLGTLGALATGMLVEHGQVERMHAFAAAFAVGGVAALISSWYLTRVAEPSMPPRDGHISFVQLIRRPTSDPAYRRLLVFMAAWNFASNFAGPFLTVYLLDQLRLGLGTVAILSASSAIANVLTLYLWGNLSDRLSNKAVLSVALPLYFGCWLGLVFADTPGLDQHRLSILVMVHVAMGIAGGGAGLAIGNLGLKLAPERQGTSYLAVLSLVGATAAATASLAGGALAGWFASRELSVVVHWTSPGTSRDVVLAQFQHWEFLFAIAAALGLYAMHALSRITEGEEHSERVVMQQFLLQALRGIENLSSVDGLRLASLFPIGRLVGRLRPAGAQRPTVPP